MLADHCYACHTNSKLGGLRLDTREALLQGGNSGPAVVPGDPDQSLLMRAVRQTDEKLKMPLGGRLEERQIQVLAEWIRRGAVWPEDYAPNADASGHELVLTPQQKSFWSFQPLKKPQPPAPQQVAGVGNEIDRFILAKLTEQGLEPVGAADRRTLIRRATLDLAGLPPTPNEVDAFVNDHSPQAFERVIDRLLASPHYGERWGRYWLDVVRYGETDVRGAVSAGYMPYHDAYRYRDWVIQALNQDMPYDKFLKAQLAADFFPGGERDQMLPALGMLGLGPWYWDLTEPPIARADERHDRVDVVTRGLLGVTVACARCHNHKYDPFSMKDYYGIAGVFGNTRYREYPLVDEQTVQAYHEHQKKIQKQKKIIKDLLDSQSQQLAEMLVHHTTRYMAAAWRVLGPPRESVVKAAAAEQIDFRVLLRWVDFLPAANKRYPYLSEWQSLLERGGTLDDARQVAATVQNTILAILEEKKDNDKENQIRLAGAPKHDLEDILTPDYFQTYEQFCPRCDVGLQALDKQKYFLYSDLMEKQEVAGKSRPGVLVFKDCELDEMLSAEWKSHLTLLRSDLALLEKALPEKYALLHGVEDAAEVKEILLQLRGNAYNLGEEVARGFPEVLSGGRTIRFTQGSGRMELAEAVAAHPLAARVIVNRVWHWHFGRGIVATPSNFGQVGEKPTHPELLEYLASSFVESGMSLKALHRQIMLSAAYQLSTEYSEKNYAKDAANRYLWRFNGRRLDAEALRDSLLFVSGNLDEKLGGPSLDWNLDHKRRAVYGKVSRFRVEPFLALFDFPEPSITSEKRNVTLVPSQRLFFLNSDFVMKQAEKLAHRLASAGDNEERIRQAYRLVYGRQPSQPELQLGLEFLAGAVDGAEGPGTAWRQYARVLLGSNEFLYLN